MELHEKKVFLGKKLANDGKIIMGTRVAFEERHKLFGIEDWRVLYGSLRASLNRKASFKNKLIWSTKSYDPVV